MVWCMHVGWEVCSCIVYCVWAISIFVRSERDSCMGYWGGVGGCVCVYIMYLCV